MATDRPAADPNRPSPKPGEAEQRNRPAAEAGRETAGDRFREAAQARQGDDEAEAEVWRGGFSSKAMIGQWLSAAVATVVMLIAVLVFSPASAYMWGFWALASACAWGGVACLLAYYKMSRKYQLTTQRFIHESGLLKRVTDRIEVIDIDDVSVVQGLLERMVGVGTIKLVSSDRSHPVLTLPGIENVKDVAAQIDDLRRKERRRRGLHIESI